MRVKNKDLREALKLLQKAFIVNMKVKRDAYHHTTMYDTWEREYVPWTEVSYEKRDSMYEEKEDLITQAIKLIRKKSLPIKYGKNKKIIYFEYLGRQVSFHDPHGMYRCKPFKGKWNGRHQKKSPFSDILSKKEIIST